jgi:glutamate formiminotransferase
MKQLIECVPNFSEGRRPEVIAAIADAIRGVGATVLDTHSDPDHNRSVITFAGESNSVEQGAFAAIEKAAELIDLDHHQGVHPRIGATDVVPFIPIHNTEMIECVSMAHRVGERVGKQLKLPVYMYKEASTKPTRYELTEIRRGGYELLKTAIATDPTRYPDYGPAWVPKAGGVAIGARDPLIAFNVYLNTDNVQIAKQIAKAIRYSSGGLRYVQAAGFLVKGRAQVSMNLQNYRVTPILSVMDLLLAQAGRYGVTIESSEVVGMIPEDALLDVARATLRLHDFPFNRILERGLRPLIYDVS